jgi:hypothetical protein
LTYLSIYIRLKRARRTTMIYLVRSSRFLKFDEGFEEKTDKLVEHLRKSYPQIKDMKFLWNVAGPVNEIHWVLEFASLADEDAWAAKIIKDEVYREWFQASMELMSAPVDRLYRDAPM